MNIIFFSIEFLFIFFKVASSPSVPFSLVQFLLMTLTVLNIRKLKTQFDF